MISLLYVLACQGKDEGTTPGTDDSVAEESTAPDDSGVDTAIEWTTLAADCTAPDELPGDPLELAGAKQITQINPGEFFVEIVDLELGPDELVYSVGQGGLVVYDFSDIDNVQDLGSWPDPHSKGRFHRVEALSEEVVAVVHRDEGMQWISVADPNDLQPLGAVLEYGMEGLAKVGDLLYVSSREGLIRIWDVSEPTAPVELDAVTGMPENTWELSKSGDGWLYASDQTEGLVPISLADPQAPARGTTLDFGVGVQHAAVHGDWIYVALGGHGIGVVDRSDPSAPVEVGRFPTGGSVVQVAVGEGVLWAADHDGIAAFSLEDPSSPSPLARETSEQFALAVAAEGHSAWLGDWSWLGRWDLDTSLSSPEAKLDRTELAFDEDGDSQFLRITNYGSDTLELLGATAEGVELAASASSVAPGDTALLRIDFAGGELESKLCLATNDPDQPLQEIWLLAGENATWLGRPAPDFTLQDLDGNTHKLSEQLGHPVVLAYFATW